MGQGKKQTMKTKIISIIICILLIAISVSAIKPKESKSYQTPPNSTQICPRGDWTEIQKLLSLDGASNDQFGWSVSLDGDIALIGAPYNSITGMIYRGDAYVFTKSGTNLVFSISGGLGVKLKITNNGTSNANDVPWQIHVQGGIIERINKTVNGTVDVPLGESMTIVETGLFFGLGSVTITAKVAEEEKTATGTQFIIFSMVK